MKCKKCGSSLRDTDKICLNCGRLVHNSITDMYDEIEIDEDTSKTENTVEDNFKVDIDSNIKENEQEEITNVEIEDEENSDVEIDFDDDFESEEKDERYNKELEALLNSYETDLSEKSVNDIESDAPDYSSFDEYNENKEINNNFNSSFSDNTINNYNNNFNNPSTEYTSEEKENSNFDVNNLIEFTDNRYISDNDNELNEDSYEEKKKFDIGSIPFKVVFIIALVVLLILLGILGYKYLLTHRQENKTEIKNGADEIKSKYSLTKNPNYIKGHTWVCGNKKEDGNMTDDVSKYFQYDFNLDKTYARQFIGQADTYESGTYGVSLEEINDNTYTYNVTLIARLDNSYKTRYTFTLITNKEGTKATYKYNGTEMACEEMNYYNNK